MDENLEAQEPDTNLMATLWQPYGNLMIGLGKILRSEDIKSILNIRDIHLAETKNNAYLCHGFSFQWLFRLLANTSGLLQDNQTNQCLPLHFFPKDWIVGTDLVLDVHSIKNRLPGKVGGFCTFKWSALKKHS